MIISSIKPNNTYPFNKIILAKGKQFNDATHKYSYHKLQNIFKIEELEFLFRFLYENHHDEIFKLSTNKEVEHKHAYYETLDFWIAMFNN